MMFGNKLVAFVKAPDKHRSLFPPELARLIELNDWHLGQSVADHSRRTLQGVRALARQTIPALAPHDLSSRISTYLAAMVGDVSRLQLLEVAALVHDVGKIDVLRTDDSGRTSAPEHARQSAERVKRGIRALKLNAAAAAYVVDLVGAHHDMDSVFDAESESTRTNELRRFKEGHGELSPDLLLFYVADYEGCRTCSHIAARKRRDYQFIADTLTQWLEV